MTIEITRKVITRSHSLPPTLSCPHTGLLHGFEWLQAVLGWDHFGAIDDDKQLKHQPGKQHYCSLGTIYLALT